MVKEAFLNYLINLDVEVIQVLNEFNWLLSQGLVIHHYHPGLYQVFDKPISHEFKNDRIAIEDREEDTKHQFNFFEPLGLKHMEQASSFFVDDLIGMSFYEFILYCYYQHTYSFLLIEKFSNFFFNLKNALYLMQIIITR